MAAKSAETSIAVAEPGTSSMPQAAKTDSSAREKKVRKDVPGSLSYSFTPSRFKEMLQALIDAERPPVFNRQYIETVLSIKGGTVTGFPPIMRRLGFLSSDNKPTDLYAQFQTESSRSSAALAGLKNGFGELFKRNAYVQRCDDNQVRDYVVQITGRKRDDQVVNAIVGTFNAVRGFITKDTGFQVEEPSADNPVDAPSMQPATTGLGLSYHINIVLPETKDIAVFNAIFRSLKQNLLS